VVSVAEPPWTGAEPEDPPPPHPAIAIEVNSRNRTANGRGLQVTLSIATLAPIRHRPPYSFLRGKY
jgi:hypothetical protein